MSTKTKQNKTFATFEPNFEFQLDGVVDHRKCCIMHTTCKIVADKAINGPKFANMLPRIRQILPTLAILKPNVVSILKASAPAPSRAESGAPRPSARNPGSAALRGTASGPIP